MVPGLTSVGLIDVAHWLRGSVDCGVFPDQVEPMSLALAADSLPLSSTRETLAVSVKFLPKYS